MMIVVISSNAINCQNTKETRFLCSGVKDKCLAIVRFDAFLFFFFSNYLCLPFFNVTHNLSAIVELKILCLGYRNHLLTNHTLQRTLSNVCVLKNISILKRDNKKILCLAYSFEFRSWLLSHPQIITLNI